MFVLKYMKLYYSVTSPFARKVRISAMVLGLDSEIELVPTDVYSADNFYVTKINPLNKIPALEIRLGEILTNSPFICDYLNSISLSRKIIPGNSFDRWSILNRQSIGDGIMEASVLRRYESLRPLDRQDVKFDQRQKDKVQNGLRLFEENIARIKTDFEIDGITLLCALGYLEFRFSDEKWVEKFPRLNDWYKKHSQWAPFLKTKPN